VYRYVRTRFRPSSASEEASLAKAPGLLGRAMKKMKTPLGEAKILLYTWPKTLLTSPRIVLNDSELFANLIADIHVPVVYANLRFSLFLS
jgi:hypothetical protein